ncbi:unnamed protein product [Rotaria sp. Silwood2]|nr:unnamed protein product [Rotaria sp. Silwood2]CAF2640436.1 unnamed protein product [Rotaria sp. Silwood2]CAF2914356.1 unnamed protein product [Rotaria sp. Silwood2]CAF3986777.1 unnamed protein product [Rotaria sp. Silwood2]CAF4179990.1 unnamed protein product [Rotaria sp. Silwood2]
MPKSRRKNGTSKNVPASVAPPIPLLDSIRAQIQAPHEHNNDTESDIDNLKVSTAGWQCDIDDWSDRKASNNGPDIFPQTIRSLERKNEQAKNKLFPLTQLTTDVDENKMETKGHINNRMKKISTKDIDLLKLTSIVNDLITGKRDQSAYTDFLSILQHFSVHTLRDDHLEETVYHLIQAGVSFVRSNEERFDPSKLQECYRQRSTIKNNSLQ